MFFFLNLFHAELGMVRMTKIDSGILEGNGISTLPLIKKIKGIEKVCRKDPPQALGLIGLIIDRL